MNGKISVIVPIYKVEKYLDKCVESIIRQTYSNLEIILVDDGSPDNSPSMCDKWATIDSRIKVIHKENGGLSDARNAGIREATGNYISFIDSDDWIEKDFIKLLYDTMQAEKADIVECGVAFVSENGENIRFRQCEKKGLHLTKIEALKCLILEDNVAQTVWNKLYKKEIIDGLWFEVGRCNEDEFWTYQVLDRIDKMVVIDAPLYNYFQRNSSIMGEEYSLKRLHGLEARFLRMDYLKKYKELSELAQTYLRFDCLFHFQAAIKWLYGSDQKVATDYIIQNMNKLNRIKKSEIGLKYYIWFTMFEKMPFFIAKLRNILGIGKI